MLNVRDPLSRFFSRMITSSHEGCWGQVIFCSCVEVSTHSNSRCCSHGAAKLIELRSPRQGVPRTLVRPIHCGRQDDRDGGTRARDKPCGSRYRPRLIRSMCKYHALVVRPACNPLRWYRLVSPSLSSLRPRHRRTSHPVAAYRGGHQNSSYSRSSGSKERNQSLSRHLAARTLCGSLAEIRQGSLPSRMAGFSFDVARDQAAFNTAPSGTSPCVRQSAISSLRARATIVIRRIRPRSFPTRARNQPLSALPG
jgi:hypothetical protein